MDYVINKCECTINQGNLSIAATYRNYKFVELALTKYKKNLSHYNPEKNDWPIRTALDARHINICKLFIDHNYSKFHPLDKQTPSYLKRKYLKLGWTDCTNFLE